MKIQDLSVNEKVQLAQEIWDSVAAEQNVIELSHEQKNVLNERLKAFESDNNLGSSWDEVKNRIAG